MIQMSIHETPYGHLHVQQSGEGTPVLWLHGFLENLNIFHPLIRMYQKPAKHILIDLPGYGISSADDAFDFSMPKMAEAVNHILAKLSITNAHIIAHSMGGYVALQLADKYPDRIKSLLLMHSTAVDDNEQKKQNRNRTIEVVRQDYTILLNEFYRNLFYEANRERFAGEIEYIRRNAGEYITAETIIRSLEGMRDRPSMIDMLKNRKFKLRYMIGRHDPLFVASELIAQALDVDADCDVLEMSGHMGYIEEKEKCLSLITSFVESSESV